ncbi:outer membrane beta-barrel protein [Amylibacter sp.]|nr:outer membrane beta-barrel protein [Amylibacter sp.]
MNKFNINIKTAASIICLVGYGSSSYSESIDAHDWNGFYAGVQAPLMYADDVDLSTETGSMTDVMRGLYVGVNKIHDNILVGIEFGYSVGDILVTEGDLGYRPVSEENWAVIETMTSLRARVGIDLGNSILYVSGGLVEMRGETGSSTGDSYFGPARSPISTIKGIGYETVISKDLTMRFEYANIRPLRFAPPETTAFGSASFDNGIHIFNLGITKYF